MHILVIGAGIVGLAIAHRALDQGHRVTLIDRGETTAASRGNAGVIAHADIMPLASPRMILEAARWLVDPLGPLAIRPSSVPRLIPWLIRFLLCSTPGRVERSIQGIVPLQAAALPAWERLMSRLRLHGEFNRHGMLYVCERTDAFDARKPVYRRQIELGVDLELIDGSVIRTLEPALSDKLQRAAYFPAMVHVNDPYDLALKLAAALADRGAQMEEGHVSSIAIASNDEPVAVLEGGRSIAADRIVVAAGAWSKPLAACLGDSIPLDTERGYNATIQNPGISLTRPVLFEEHAFVMTPLRTGLRVGGAVELASTAAKPNWDRVQAMLAKARYFAPGLEPANRVEWMGCRPSLPDTLPVISTSRWCSKVLYAFGHGHHGLTQAAITAELIGAMIAGEQPAIELAPYSARRF